MQILEPHPRPPKSETGDRTQPAKGVQWTLEFEGYWCKYRILVCTAVFGAKDACGKWAEESSVDKMRGSVNFYGFYWEFISESGDAR